MWLLQTCSSFSLLLTKQLLVSSAAVADLNSRNALLIWKWNLQAFSSYFVVSAAADRGNGGPEARIHGTRVSKPKHIITLLSDSRRLVVRLSEDIVSWN